MLKPALEDVDLAQQSGLILGQTAIRDKRLEGLRGVGATMRQKADQTRSGARFKDLDVGVQHRGVVTGDDHRPVGVVGLRRLEGATPLGGIEPTAEFLDDRQVECLAVLVDRLEEARQAGLLGLEGLVAMGRCFSLTGQLRDCVGRGSHLAAVGALSAGADRAMALMQLWPQAFAVDEDATLVEDAVEKERRVFLDLGKTRDIDPAATDAFQANSQVERSEGTIAGERDQQVQVGVRVLVAARKGAVEHGEADATLGAERPTELGEESPVGAQVIALAGSQA